MMDRQQVFRDAGPLWAVLMLVAVAIVFSLVLFRPRDQLPIDRANGVYANTCCAPLSLADGKARSDDVMFSYVIEPGKDGPQILVREHSLGLTDGHLFVVEGAGLYLPLAPSRPSSWLEVRGVRFSRTSASTSH